MPDQDSVPDQEAEPSARPALRDAAFYAAAIVSGLFLLRLLGAAWGSGFPAVWPDATFAREGYLAVAAKRTRPARLAIMAHRSRPHFQRLSPCHLFVNG